VTATPDYLRGLKDATDAVMIETKAWRDMACETTREHKNRVVCAAIADALLDLAERMVAAMQAQSVTVEQVKAGGGR
jgi:hypothetical protein